MAIDWDDDFGKDPFGDGQSADVFGSNLDDVDVWKGHDSFDGDQEWIDFNDDDPEEELEGGDNPDRVSKSGSGKSSSSAGKRRSKKHGGSSSRSSKSSSSSKKTSSSRSGSSSNSKSRKSSSRHGSHRESSRRLVSGDNKYLQEEDDPFLIESSSAHGHEHRGASPAPSSRSPTRQSSRGSRPKSHRSGYTDDAIASSYRTTNSSNSSRSGSSRRTPNLVRRSDGTVSQRRPRDQMAHDANSRDRRASVRDSLFKSLGDEDDDEDDGFHLPPKSMRGPSLSGFLDHNSDKKSEKGRSDGSVRSAPAASEEHRRRSQQGKKSRRWHNKMLLPPSGRESSSKKGGDDAAASEAGLNIQNQGYIEVVDGKMRLVFDVEP